MPARSATRPMRPSSASISRTRWPLPSPPMAGLQDISPMVCKAMRHQRRCGAETRRRAGRLAARMAAPDHDDIESRWKAQSRCLTPTDRAAMKKFNASVSRETLAESPGSFADAELPEHHVQHILAVDPPQQPLHGPGGTAQMLGHQLEPARAQQPGRFADFGLAARHGTAMPFPRDQRRLLADPSRQAPAHPAEQPVDPLARRCRDRDRARRRRMRQRPDIDLVPHP